MRNEFRMYLCELLLNLIMRIAPNNNEGWELTLMVSVYIKKYFNN